MFAYPHGWQAAPVEEINRERLEHLQNLAEMLRYYVPVVQNTGLETVKAYAEGVKAALEDDDSIPQQLRIHAHEVIQHLLWCVDHYNVAGDFILAEAVERLAATIVRVAAKRQRREP